MGQGCGERWPSVLPAYTFPRTYAPRRRACRERWAWAGLLAKLSMDDVHRQLGSPLRPRGRRCPRAVLPAAVPQLVDGT